MKFIVKDEPAGWAISVWVMDDRPTGWLLMVADSVINGEIIWRWDPISEAQELPSPTFRFNWDFIEEFAASVQKKIPKRVDDELMKTLDIERSRVDSLLNFLTHRNTEQTLTPHGEHMLEHLKKENAMLKHDLQDLQSQLLAQAHANPDFKPVPKKKTGMEVADQVIKEAYEPNKPIPGAFVKAVESEMENIKKAMSQGQIVSDHKHLWLSPQEFAEKNLEAMGFVTKVDPDKL